MKAPAPLCRLALLLLPLLAACSPQANTPIARQWEAFNTRFNVYHNGAVHFCEEMQRMENDYADDYSRLLPVEPALARADETLPQPSGDFSLTLEKMQKALELHSLRRKPPRASGSREEREFRSRGEFNPFIHNAWMLLGQAQYQSGDFKGAAATFAHTAALFTWLPDVVAEARLRQALALAANGQTFAAANVLRPVKPDRLTSGKLALLDALARSAVAVADGNFREAAISAGRAAGLAKGRQRNRLRFLEGQLWARLDSLHLAGEAFRLAGQGAAASLPMRLNARIRQAETAPEGSWDNEIKALRRLASQEANVSHRGLLLYAAGRLQIASGDTAGAHNTLRRALESRFPTVRDKAVAQLQLARLLFDRRDYLGAQPLYSEALPALVETRTAGPGERMREAALAEYARYAGACLLQDSLLRLAELPPDLLSRTARRLASEERRRIEETQRRRDEDPESPVVRPAPGQVHLPPSQPTQDEAWYFYNPRLRDAGKAEFRRIWGFRKPVDDWRWASAEGNGALPGDGAETDHATDSFTSLDPEWYLAAVPKSEAQIANSRRIVMESLFNMGRVLQDDLGDPAGAREAYDELDRRFPGHPYGPVLERNRSLLVLQADPAARTRARFMAERHDSLYGKALEAYLAGDYEVAERMYDSVANEWERSPVLPKLLFLRALGSVARGDTAAFPLLLGRIAAQWAGSDPAPLASQWLDRLAEGAQTVPSPALPLRRPVAGLNNLPADSAQAVAPLPFTAEPDAPHLVALVYAADSVSPNLVLFLTARFSFSTFPTGDYPLALHSLNGSGALTVSGFTSRLAAQKYLARLNAAGPFDGRPVKGLVISVDDFNRLAAGRRPVEDYLLFLEQTGDESDQP